MDPCVELRRQTNLTKYTGLQWSKVSQLLIVYMNAENPVSVPVVWAQIIETAPWERPYVSN